MAEAAPSRSAAPTLAVDFALYRTIAAQGGVFTTAQALERYSDGRSAGSSRSRAVATESLERCPCRR